MYKISINETPVFLINKTDLDSFGIKDKKTLVAPYMGKPKILLSYADMLEKGSSFNRIILHADSAKSIFKDFKTLYTIIPAAGGLVLNEKNEILAIHRLGFWDLPKGKIDPGEGKKAAALREVREETGLSNLILAGKVLKTYHTYKDRKKRRILKKTYWYLMHTTDTELTPETEENIELAVWKNIDEFLQECKPVYNTILDVVIAGLEKMKKN